MIDVQYTIGMNLPSHTLQAHNNAADSANKIHDDRVAAQYGFRGGLVPGVTVYAYMTYPLVQCFGEAWLSRGTAQLKLVKPCYEGDQVTVTATVSDVTDDELCFEVRSTNAQGIDCGVGMAVLPTAATVAPGADDIPAGAPRPSVPASWEAIVVGEPLPALQFTVTEADNQSCCSVYGDDLAVYQGRDGCLHPGFLLHQCNRIFSERFELGPWIHVASNIGMYRPCRVGDVVQVRGIPVDKFDKKGHEFVVLDVLLLTNGEVAQRVTHTCIYRPRKG
jgi:acyl dehydratase